jgi:hypothetical protein
MTTSAAVPPQPLRPSPARRGTRQQPHGERDALRRMFRQSLDLTRRVSLTVIARSTIRQCGDVPVCCAQLGRKRPAVWRRPHPAGLALHRSHADFGDASHRYPGRRPGSGHQKCLSRATHKRSCVLNANPARQARSVAGFASLAALRAPSKGAISSAHRAGVTVLPSNNIVCVVSSQSARERIDVVGGAVVVPDLVKHGKRVDSDTV